MGDGNSGLLKKQLILTAELSAQALNLFSILKKRQKTLKSRCEKLAENSLCVYNITKNF